MRVQLGPVGRVSAAVLVGSLPVVAAVVLLFIASSPEDPDANIGAGLFFVFSLPVGAAVGVGVLLVLGGFAREVSLARLSWNRARRRQSFACARSAASRSLDMGKPAQTCAQSPTLSATVLAVCGSCAAGVLGRFCWRMPEPGNPEYAVVE